MGIRKYTHINENIEKYQVINIDGLKDNLKVILPIILIIEENKDGIFLYRYDSDKNFLGDTLHFDIEEVMNQIEYEIGYIPEKWYYLPQSSENVIESTFEYLNIPSKYYSIKYMHDYFTESLWSNNEEANNKYGYSIILENLPISTELIKELEKLANDYSELINPDYPPDTVITPEFMMKSKDIYQKLTYELGDNFIVVDKTNY